MRVLAFLVLAVLAAGVLVPARADNAVASGHAWLLPGQSQSWSAALPAGRFLQVDASVSGTANEARAVLTRDGATVADEALPVKTQRTYTFTQPGAYVLTLSGTRGASEAWAFLREGEAPAGAGPGAAADLGPEASLHGAAIFPADSAWNRDVSADPVDPLSDALIAAMDPAAALHPDFGTSWAGGDIGIPYVVVGAATPRVPVVFDYPGESDLGPYPIPADAPMESGSDHHVLVLDRDAWKLYELYAAQRPTVPGGAWHASSGAVFDLRGNLMRPVGWTSADAAGLPILPGLVRWDEVHEQGAIRHALRFTLTATRAAYLYPARHCASVNPAPQLPAMGLRVRLKAGVDVSGFSPANQVVLKALKTYGMILADNGSDWYVSGAHDARWNDDELGQLKTLHGSDFEVVQQGTAVATCFT